MIRNRKRRCQPRRLDAEQVDQSLDAVVAWPLHHKVLVGHGGRHDLRPDSCVARLQGAVGQPGPVTADRRIEPGRTLRIDGQTIHQIALPWHWGHNGYTTGDSANELTNLALDPNVHIHEVKALTCDIRPGRRPRGPALADLIREYRKRAGITEQTGTEM